MFSLLHPHDHQKTIEELRNIFVKFHNISLKVVTNLIHPTAVTITPFSALLENDLTAWSQYSQELFNQLARQRIMFTPYTICDMLYAVGEEIVIDRILAAVNDISLSEYSMENLEELINIISSSVAQTLYLELKLINAIPRINDIAKEMDLAARIFLTLGVCPMVGENQMHREHASDDSSFERYLKTLERGVEMFSVMRPDDIISNLLLMFQDGKYTATKYDGSTVTLISFADHLEILNLRSAISLGHIPVSALVGESFGTPM